MYANVLIEYNVLSLDKEFTYIIPSSLKDIIKVGMQVVVPFGKSIINGFVTKITNDTKLTDLKEIIRIKNPEFILNQELLELGEYLSKVTLCSKISAYQTMLPSAIKIKDNHLLDKFITYIKLNKSILDIEMFINNNKRSKKQIAILEQLLNEDKVLKKDVSGPSLNELLKQDMVIEVKEELYRINNNEVIEDKVILNVAQQKVFDEVIFNNSNTYLLHGITGSGKTEIYIKLIKKAINNNMSALMLVPEITLNAQMVKRIYKVFGNDVAIINSGLSSGERYDEYKKIYKGLVKVVVGTRSSAFVPLKNIGVIIVDEEQSDSYKQENNPRYDAIDILKVRSKTHNCPLILGSATPTLDSYARAKKGVYQLLNLNKRANNATLPIIHLVNMEEEYVKHNMIISDFLKELIEERLNNHEQIILLLNRRGYSTVLTCPNCGYKYKCPHCDITLTYHKTSNNLRCHYCGYTVYKKDKCPNCNGNDLYDLGLGTEKLESTINTMFPSAKTIRMDMDSTTKKGSHEKILEAFSNNEYDILLGTQMISKGLDFPKVTLVGVINADQSLNMPDYKANEKTFSLLSQVSGRAGRSNLPGDVVIQTMNPTDYTYNCVKDNNYLMFYNYEMRNRLNMKFPPYYFLCNIKIVSKDYEKVRDESTKVFKYLKTHLKDMEVLGPTMANIFKMKNMYRFSILIKYRKINNLYEVLKDVNDIYKQNKIVYLEIDTSPKTI